MATAGDSWARYKVRMEEMRESLRIIRPGAGHSAQGRAGARQAPGGAQRPAGALVSRVEAARGEIAFFLVGDGTDKPWRVKIRSPSFSNLAALPEMVKGWRVADVVTILSTLDVVIPDIDR